MVDLKNQKLKLFTHILTQFLLDQSNHEHLSQSKSRTSNSLFSSRWTPPGSLSAQNIPLLFGSLSSYLYNGPSFLVGPHSTILSQLSLNPYQPPTAARPPSPFLHPVLLLVVKTTHINPTQNIPACMYTLPNLFLIFLRILSVPYAT